MRRDELITENALWKSLAMASEAAFHAPAAAPRAGYDGPVHAKCVRLAAQRSAGWSPPERPYEPPTEADLWKLCR